MLTKHTRENISSHLVSTGLSVKNIWTDAAKKYKLKVKISGINPLATLSFNGPNPPAQMTLFTQEMLQRGYLTGKSFYAMGAHKNEDIDQYGEACNEVFKFISNCIDKNLLFEKIKGPIAHSGFKRLN